MQGFYRYNPFFRYSPYKRNLYYNIPPSFYNSAYMNNTSVNSKSYKQEILPPPPPKKENKDLPPNSDFVLDLFGLHLYYDDVLILGLLFFLYKEDVKDEGLFLALVMLLIS